MDISKFSNSGRVVIAIYGKHLDPLFKNDLEVLFEILDKNHVDIVVYAPFYEYLNAEFSIKLKAALNHYSTRMT